MRLPIPIWETESTRWDDTGYEADDQSEAGNDTEKGLRLQEKYSNSYILKKEKEWEHLVKIEMCPFMCQTLFTK